MAMQDVTGRAIALGNIVAFAYGQTHAMTTGIVIKLNKKTITIGKDVAQKRWDALTGCYFLTGVFEKETWQRLPENVCIVEHGQAQ